MVMGTMMKPILSAVWLLALLPTAAADAQSTPAQPAAPDAGPAAVSFDLNAVPHAEVLPPPVTTPPRPHAEPPPPQVAGPANVPDRRFVIAQPAPAPATPAEPEGQRSRCVRTANGQQCSYSYSTGSSPEAARAAEEALQRSLRDTMDNLQPH